MSGRYMVLTGACVLLGMLVLFGWYLLITEKRDCDRRGGVYLKTLWTYECVFLKEGR